MCRWQVGGRQNSLKTLEIFPLWKRRLRDRTTVTKENWREVALLSMWMAEWPGDNGILFH